MVSGAHMVDGPRHTATCKARGKFWTIAVDGRIAEAFAELHAPTLEAHFTKYTLRMKEKNFASTAPTFVDFLTQELFKAAYVFMSKISSDNSVDFEVALQSTLKCYKGLEDVIYDEANNGLFSEVSKKRCSAAVCILSCGKPGALDSAESGTRRAWVWGNCGPLLSSTASVVAALRIVSVRHALGYGIRFRLIAEHTCCVRSRSQACPSQRHWAHEGRDLMIPISSAEVSRGLGLDPPQLSPGPAQTQIHSLSVAPIETDAY